MLTSPEMANTENPPASSLGSLADHRGFAVVYREHVGRVYALALRMGGSKEAAEDITQEAFFRAWKKRRQYREDVSLGGWLARITANVGISRYRKELRTTSRDVCLDAERLASGEGADAAGELRMDLQRCIASLPPACRVVFVLHEIERYTHEEIARRARIAVGTSKAHLHRARRLMREELTR